jgi:outer membrane protein assembly factor BamA
LKRKIIPYIYILFLLVFSDPFFSQDFNLTITSKNKKENAFLSKINYQKKHLDSTFIKTEIGKIAKYLKNEGYFTNTLDSVQKNKKNYVAYFSLHEKIEKAILKNTNKEIELKGLNKKNNSFSIPIAALQKTLLKISKKLDTEGKSFSKISLQNIKLKNKTLFADLQIDASKKRIIDKIIVKEYEKFPKSFIKHYLNLRKGAVFNQQKINNISNASKNLPFIREIKPPEVLFLKDSTLIYLYLKKQQNNSFDGLVNFASQENGAVLFNGNIDIKLHNVLNTGEKLELFWNSIGNERQEFKLLAEIPYIFKSKITPEVSFSIYKQDSTFLSTQFDSKLFYNLNTSTKLAITYTSENSENLEETINNNITTFSNYFLGFQFQYKQPKRDFFFNDIFYIDIKPGIGKRKTENTAVNQFKIETTASYIWDLNSRNSLFIRNKSGYLNSDSFIDNEIFRIGGANSVRGFNEQSLFTNNYSFFNIEYRFLTSKKSYFYSITDIANIKTSFKRETLLGIGLGYLFTSNTSQINLSTAIGKNSSQNFNFENSKLIISWKNYF